MRDAVVSGRWPVVSAALGRVALAVCLTCAAGGCRSEGIVPSAHPPAALFPADAALAGRIASAERRATEFLIARQSADGAWRSSTYGLMKDGPSLTAHVALALSRSNDPAARLAVGRAAAYLARLTEGAPEKLDDADLMYPVYTSADAVRLLRTAGATPNAASAEALWLVCLRRQQLNESLGWHASDLDYGGWSFALLPPPHPTAARPAGPWDWSNLSVTRDAISALRAAGLGAHDPAIQEALTLVFRCQNVDSRGAVDAAFDDGGFFFAPGGAQPERNKAGVAGADAQGRLRYRSYGSMTVDGLRAMLDAGLPPDHPRVIAARRWLEKNLSTAHNPGAFEAEDLRDATYYYYCNGLAEVMRRLRRDDPRQPGLDRHASSLADELLRRQREDGSWSNPFTDAREDDPLVATPMALEALNDCLPTKAAPVE